MEIDKFFEKIYAPFHKNAEWFEVKYLPQTSGILKKGLLCVGRSIPRNCWFRKTFNLNWTPCMMNPFFMHMLALAEWASYEDYSETLDRYIEVLNNYEDASKNN